MNLIRTLLFVPAQREAMVEKSHAHGADVIVLDLEEAVPEAAKAAAREIARRHLPVLGGEGRSVCARVNDVRSGMTRDDLLAVVSPALRAVVLPKAEQAQDVRDVDVLLREAELANGVRPGDTGLITMIESPRALLRCEEIAQAADRHVALALGGYDYCAALGVPRTRDGAAIAHLRYAVAQVAASRGVVAVDTPYDDLEDEEGLVAETEFVKAIGYGGKFVIHPRQVAPVNRVFTPAEREVAEARRIIEAFERAASDGLAAVRLDGRMIDGPIVDRARRVLALAPAGRPELPESPT